MPVATLLFIWLRIAEAPSEILIGGLAIQAGHRPCPLQRRRRPLDTVDPSASRQNFYGLDEVQPTREDVEGNAVVRLGEHVNRAVTVTHVPPDWPTGGGL